MKISIKEWLIDDAASEVPEKIDYDSFTKDLPESMDVPEDVPFDNVKNFVYEKTGVWPSLIEVEN